MALQVSQVTQALAFMSSRDSEQDPSRVYHPDHGPHDGDNRGGHRKGGNNPYNRFDNPRPNGLNRGKYRTDELKASFHFFFYIDLSY